MTFKVNDEVFVKGWDAAHGVVSEGPVWDGPATVVTVWPDKGYSVRSRNGGVVHNSTGYFAAEYVTAPDFQVGDEVVLNYQRPIQTHLNAEVGRGRVVNVLSPNLVKVEWTNGWTTTERNDNLLSAPSIVVNPLADVTTDDLLAEIRRRTNG